MSKAALLEKLTDKTYRDAFISDEIDVGLPMQLRTMREARDWRQDEVAQKLGTQQPRMSLMEKTGYGNFSLNTLKKIASIFDVGLIVSFVPFGEMIDFTEALSNRRLAIPAFVDEYERLARKYSRYRQNTTATSQEAFDFSASTPAVYIETSAQTPVAQSTGSTFSAGELATVPSTFFLHVGSTQEVNYARP